MSASDSKSIFILIKDYSSKPFHEAVLWSRVKSENLSQLKTKTFQRDVQTTRTTRLGRCYYQVKIIAHRVAEISDETALWKYVNPKLAEKIRSLKIRE